MRRPLLREFHRPPRPAILVGDAPAAHDPAAADDWPGPRRRADDRRRLFRASVFGNHDERLGELMPAVGHFNDDRRSPARLGGPDLSHAVERPAERDHGRVGGPRGRIASRR